eukprot:SAG25_NODE_102_length_15486_cov_22.883278_10_plen_77_part_00
MSASGTGPRKTPFEPQMPGFLKLWPPTYFQSRLPGTSWEEVNRICGRARGVFCRLGRGFSCQLGRGVGRCAHQASA